MVRIIIYPRSLAHGSGTSVLFVHCDPDIRSLSTRIIKVLTQWLASPHVKVDMNVLLQMREFASSVDSSPVMSELANNVLQTINHRVCLDLSRP
jgi:hypothetical protein